MSVIGLKSRRPARASATTVSGLVTKDNVFAEPSFRFGKLRLNELTMVLGTELTSAERSHWPIHGPHALANTVAPMDSRSANKPSRSMVARICSLPGVISNSVLARKPLADACRAIDAARVMSSYDELVHEPTSAEEMLRGQLLSRAAAPTPAPTA